MSFFGLPVAFSLLEQLSKTAHVDTISLSFWKLTFRAFAVKFAKGLSNCPLNFDFVLNSKELCWQITLLQQFQNKTWIKKKGGKSPSINCQFPTAEVLLTQKRNLIEQNSVVSVHSLFYSCSHAHIKVWEDLWKKGEAESCFPAQQLGSAHVALNCFLFICNILTCLNPPLPPQLSLFPYRKP